MNVSELARRAGIAPSAVRFYEKIDVLPAAARQANGYRVYADGDLALLRLVAALRRLGLKPLDAGRLARLCVERGDIDLDLTLLIASQRAAIGRQRADLDRRRQSQANSGGIDVRRTHPRSLRVHR
jgi:DNA-binding transcriptional MerR regulator